MRVGTGYDIHCLLEGRQLVLGGVTIPFEKGLEGHSDADVLVHAVCDAILGAAGLGDIGHHFPDTAAEFKDIYSLRLLERVVSAAKERGLGIVNIDCTILAQAPKMDVYRQEMVSNMAASCGIEPGQINVKATTTEGLGVIGAGEAIAAMSVVLIEKIE